jgi:hypothetical protein
MVKKTKLDILGDAINALLDVYREAEKLVADDTINANLLPLRKALTAAKPYYGEERCNG